MFELLGNYYAFYRALEDSGIWFINMNRTAFQAYLEAFVESKLPSKDS